MSSPRWCCVKQTRFACCEVSILRLKKKSLGALHETFLFLLSSTHQGPIVARGPRTGREIIPHPFALSLQPRVLSDGCCVLYPSPCLRENNHRVLYVCWNFTRCSISSPFFLPYVQRAGECGYRTQISRRTTHDSFLFTLCLFFSILFWFVQNISVSFSRQMC